MAGESSVEGLEVSVKNQTFVITSLQEGIVYFSLSGNSLEREKIGEEESMADLLSPGFLCSVRIAASHTSMPGMVLNV